MHSQLQRSVVGIASGQARGALEAFKQKRALKKMIKKKQKNIYKYYIEESGFVSMIGNATAKIFSNEHEQV